MVGGAVGGCLLLLGSVLVGGAINEGYSQTRDYVSALSGRGSTAAVVGMVGLLGFAAAHAAAGLAVRPHSRVAAVAFVLAAVAGVVVTVARISCPTGAAECSIEDSAAPDWLDRVHGLGVATYEVFFLVGLLAAAGWLLRCSRPAASAAGVALALLGLLSAVLVLATPEQRPGAVQRAWLVVNSVAVILVAVVAVRKPQPTQIGRDDDGVSSV